MEKEKEKKKKEEEKKKKRRTTNCINFQGRVISNAWRVSLIFLHHLFVNIILLLLLIIRLNTFTVYPF